MTLTEFLASVPAGEAHEQERAYLLAVLENNQWNVSQSAKQAGRHRGAFAKLLKKHGIKREEPSRWSHHGNWAEHGL